MKTLLATILFLAASTAAAYDWRGENVNRQASCLFGVQVYALPGTTCNGHLPVFRGYGKQVDHVTFDSGLGNYTPSYPYPYFDLTLENDK